MAEQKTAIGEFKDFVMKGNVVDLAVAVIMAQFFGAVVKDAVNLILSLLAVPGSSAKPAEFSSLSFTLHGGTFHYGLLIADTITFLIVAVVVFFAIVRPMQTLLERRRTQPEPESDDRPCPECLSEIPKAAVRCAHCTAQISPIA